MKRYVISFINLFEGLLDIREIKAVNAKEAMILYLMYIRGMLEFDEWLESDITAEEIRTCLSERDCSIAYLEIN